MLVSSEASFLGLLDGHLPVSSRDLSSVCVHVCLQISTPYKDTSHIELEPTLMTSFYLITSLKTMSTKVFEVLVVRTSKTQHMNLWGTQSSL